MLNQDYHDLLAALVHHDVRFLVAGAHALAAHGYPRATVDIDILTGVTGLDFEHAWANRIPATLEGVQVSVLGRADLITNKQATGREKDRFDVQGLEGKS